MTKLAADLKPVYENVSFDLSPRRFSLIVRDVQRHVSASPAVIVDFINGGTDGWDVSHAAQQNWYDTNSPREIASWIIAGLK